MKTLLAKIRNKKLKGNVSLLVIFILLASSVISLLSINQIQRLLTYGNMTSNYFRAFYIAKAGTELWLTEVYNRGDGFNQILSGDFITTWNFLPEYAWFEPHFNMTITWSFKLLTNDIRETDDCDGNEIELAPNAWIMLSLFSDSVSWIPDILSDNDNFAPLLPNTIRQLEFKKSENISNNLTFAFFNYKRDDELDDYYMDNIVVKKNQSDLKAFLTTDPDVSSLINGSDSGTKKYLTIKNSWNSNVKFCISMGNDDIPYSNSLITVFWHYGDMEVWIQSVVKKWVPDWTLNVLDEPSGSN